MDEHKDLFSPRQNPKRAGHVHGKRKKHKKPESPLTSAEKKRKQVQKMAKEGDAYFRKHMR